MAIINVSSIVSGSVVAFDPLQDTLVFNDPSISASSLGFTFSSTDLNAIAFSYGGKSFTLTASVSVLQLTTGNITFADGSQLIVGDNSTATNDVLANTLVGTAQGDRLYGLQNNDLLVGGRGADLLDGGTGGDTLKGGLGADIYLVDNAGDVVDETPTVDTARVSTGAAGAQANGQSNTASLSADGRYAVFHSYASNLVDGDTNSQVDVFVKDLLTGAVQRVSTDAAGAQAVGGASVVPSFSADGRYVVFESSATNLVAGDTNNLQDIFVKDLITGAVQRISTDSAGAQGNNNSYGGSFSADGRSVVFYTASGNLVAGDDPIGSFDVFVKDLQTGAVRRVSTDAAGAQGNGNSFLGEFSADGRHLLFTSFASNLVAGDTNATRDIFIKDLQTGALQLVSTNAQGTQGNAASYNASFSADGRWVSFNSEATNLVAGDSNASVDVFLTDLQSGAVQRVSTNAAGVQGNSDSYGGSFSADGRYLAFYSYASNLIGGDGNLSPDVFVKDLQTGALQRVSTGAAGAAGDADSVNPTFSADGRYVVFESNASTLVPGDTNTTWDIFRASNPFITDAALDTVLSSVSQTLPAGVENLQLTGSSAIDGTGNALPNALTGNSAANRLTGAAGNDTLNGGSGNDTMTGGSGDDTYNVDAAGDQVVELAGAEPHRLSDGAFGQVANDEITDDAALSADGRWVLFSSLADNLLPLDSDGQFPRPDLYLRDMQTGALQPVATSAAGLPSNGSNFDGLLSPDGRSVVFTDLGQNLLDGPAFGSSLQRIYLKNMVDGSVQLVSTASDGTQANDAAFAEAFSANGRAVAFYSGATNLVAGDSNGVEDVFVKNLLTGELVRASTSSAGVQGNNQSSGAQLSADGRTVAFTSLATNLVAGDTNVTNDIFVKNLDSGLLQRVSANASGVQGNFASYELRLSADGNKVLFSSNADNLLAGDGNGAQDIFIKDMSTGAVTRVSTTAAGVEGNSDSSNMDWSADGRWVVFASRATNLVAGDTNGKADIFVKDVVSGAIARVTVSASGVQANGDAYAPRISADGLHIVYQSNASNLVAEPGFSGYNLYGTANPLAVPGGGRDTVQAGISHTVAANVENLVLTGSSALNGTGNGLANQITGNTGNNILNGSTGVDTLLGGEGNDTYVVDNPGDKVTEAASSGTDTVNAGVAWSLPSNVEKLLLTGTGSINGTGNTLNNTLTGNAGNNVLDGGAGNDTMAGGTGNDSYVVGASGDVVTESASAGTDTVQAAITFSLAALANVENLVLTGSGNLNATGNTANNVITGNAGNNVLSGGSGDDTASYANATAGVNVNLGFTGAQNTGFGSDTLVSIERLTGSTFEDNLVGNSGNNTLDGGAGLDLLIGGLGNDSYVVDSLGDVVVEDLNEGTDLVQARYSYRLGDNAENLTLLGSGNTSAVGNALANVITGNAGNNVLNGGAGTDTASYANATQAVNANLATKLATGYGSDTLTAFENLTGSGYNDTLAGSSGNNVLDGGAGNDSLAAGSGNDTLDGGTGKDTLDGSAGLDTFRFNSTLNASTNVDTISGFLAADDRIELENSVFLKLTTTGLLASTIFRASSTGTAADGNDFVLYENDTGKLFYDADGNGASAAVLIATLSGAPGLSSADIFVT